MKRTVLYQIIFFLFISLMVPAAWSASDDIAKHPACKLCGMDRAKFSHSRVLIEYEDGSAVGLCSIHCAAVEMALNLDRTPGALFVADHASKSLIDAEKALWVIGGSQKGVMTGNPKWAFEKQETAKAFRKANGGSTAAFEDVIKATYNDMYEDTKMIREKRRAMKQHSGHRRH